MMAIVVFGYRGGPTRHRLVAWRAWAPAATILAMIAGAVAAPGAEAASTAAPVEVVAPRTGALVTGSEIRAVVRVRGAEKRRLRVEVHNRRTIDVTRRLRRIGKGKRRRAVTLRVGRELVPGENHLYAIVPRGKAPPLVGSAHFVVARPRQGRLLALRGVHRGVRAPLTARVRVAAGARLRARLNGRNVRSRFEPSGGRWFRARLAAHDGLRFRRNRMTLTAYTKRGRHQRLVRRFRVRRDRPLVGAGRDRRAVAGMPVRLNGSSTRASRRGHRLRVRWAIVDRPKDSKQARLRGRARARPTLVTDVPGRYTIRLRAREGRRGGRRGGRQTRPGARPSSQARALSPAATDTVTIAAQPDVAPSGVPVETIVSETEPGIQVGSTFYPAWLGEGAWVQALVLDRATLEEVSVNTYTGDWPGTGSLAADIAKLSSDELVIVSGLGRTASLDPNAQGALNDALAGPNGIGAVLPQGTAPLEFGTWSVIGVPGTPPGTAHQCILTFCWIHPGAVPGEMAGNLQLDITDNFAFNWPPTFNTFDTKAQGSTATRNVIQIAFGDNPPETFSSAQMSGPAFQLLWLDSGTLAPRGNFTYAATTGPGCGGSGCVEDLAAKLEQIAEDPIPGLIILTSFGRPKAEKTSTWGSISSTLEGMGANPWVFLGLDGSGDYTFVGLQGLPQLDGPNAGAELSQVETGATAARLAGVFVQNEQGLWQAGTNGNPTAINSPEAYEPDLTQILAQPPEPFPPFDTAGEQAAERYIADQLLALDIDLTIDPVFGLRANYWRDDSIDWAQAAAALATIGSCTVDCPDGYDDADFAAVKHELEQEFNGVAQVVEFFTGGGTANLAGELQTVASTGAYTFEGTAKQISEIFNPPRARGEDITDIIAGALWTASGFAGIVPVDEPVAAPLEIAAGLIDLTEALANSSDGSSLLDPTAFDNDVKQWGWNLANVWETTLDSVDLLADQLVSDKGRLEAAVAKIDDFQTNPAQGWGFNAQNELQLQQSMSRSLGQYMYRTMLPTVRVAFQCVTQPVPGFQSWFLESDSTPSYVRWPVIANAPNFVGGGTSVGAGFLSIGRPGDDNAYPSRAITETLFGTNYQQDYQLGLLPKYFLAPAVGDSAGFSLNTGTFYDWEWEMNNIDYDCAGAEWQANVDD